MTYQGVVFDIGGVVVHSPLEGIRKFEKRVGLPENYLNGYQSKGERGAFQRLEHPINLTHYSAYVASKGRKMTISASQVPKIDGKALFTAMMKESETIDQVVLDAIKKSEYKLAALTNNFQYSSDPADPVGQPPVNMISSLFDHYIESSVVGLRKPDPKFFLHACEILHVDASEVVFLDDIGINLKSAKDLGMTTIRVHVGRTREAIQQLEKIIGLPLLSGSKL
ncbi:HAD-like domain-containing protein [Chytridium lagenaria]|nr:HAD-like domain-containing protein [Chytridium lagenaria]